MKIKEGYQAISDIIGPCMQAAAKHEKQQKIVKPVKQSSASPPPAESGADPVAEVMALMQPYFDVEKQLSTLLANTARRAFEQLPEEGKDRLRADWDTWRAWNEELEIPPETAQQVQQLMQRCRQEFDAAGRRLGQYLDRRGVK